MRLVLVYIGGAAYSAVMKGLYLHCSVLERLRHSSTLKCVQCIGSSVRPGKAGLQDAGLHRGDLGILTPAGCAAVQIGGNTRPVRVRVLDLPFTAVEWVLPSDMLQAGGDPLTPAKWMVWDRSPLAKERSLAVCPNQFDSQSACSKHLLLCAEALNLCLVIMKPLHCALSCASLCADSMLKNMSYSGGMHLKGRAKDTVGLYIVSSQSKCRV